MNNVYIKLFKYGITQFKISTNNKYIFQGLANRLTAQNYFASMTVPSQSKSMIFQGTLDRFNGVTIDSTKENCGLDNFNKKLQDSLKSWAESNKRGIWFKIGLEQSDWVPILTKNGFDFHHAKSGYLMMNKWLPNEPSRLPVFAHTMLAVGAVVTNENNEILVVQEKNYQPGHWKFPGGIVEPGENLVPAAIREVKEETNIDFEFNSLVSLMHADQGIYGCSDLYIVVGGKALSNDIKMCEKEISKCRWISIDEFLGADDTSDFNKALARHYLNYHKNGVKIDFVSGIHKLSQRYYTMYSINFKA